jgi:hypothetical protein
VCDSMVRKVCGLAAVSGSVGRKNAVLVARTPAGRAGEGGVGEGKGHRELAPRTADTV